MSGFDYYTVIGRDPKLWAFHVENTIRNAGLERDLWNFHVLVYRHQKIQKDTTDEIVSICEANDIHFEFIDEDVNKPFIQRLYAAWNKGYELGKHDLVLRAGSDQTWSKDAFAMMVDYWDGMLWSDAILQFNTLEHHGPSRHFVRDFGARPEQYNEEAFYKFVDETSITGLYGGDEAMRDFGHPTPMIHGRIRPDGCSWLQKRSNFKKFGPMVSIDSRGITGDVTIHDAYQSTGIPSFLMGDVWTYHMVRGESAGYGQ